MVEASDIEAMAAEMVLLQHGDIISEVIHRLGNLGSSPVRCSYAANIGNYTWWKVKEHYLYTRSDGYIGHDFEQRMEQYHAARRKKQEYHLKLYDSPCYSCAVCMARKKPWPVNAGINQCASVTGLQSEPSSYRSSESRLHINHGRSTGTSIMSRRTLNEWNAAGYRIKKGSKSRGRDPETGEALFESDQVFPSSWMTGGGI